MVVGVVYDNELAACVFSSCVWPGSQFFSQLIQLENILVAFSRKMEVYQAKWMDLKSSKKAQEHQVMYMCVYLEVFKTMRLREP